MGLPSERLEECGAAAEVSMALNGGEGGGGLCFNGNPTHHLPRIAWAFSCLRKQPVRQAKCSLQSNLIVWSPWD